MKISERIRTMRKDMKIPYNENKVIPFDIDGTIIKTNYECSEYPYWDGNGCRPYRKCKFRQTDSELLDELVSEGYTYIRFVYTTTYVRGYHEISAFYR